ncbi:MAG: hypothetical protein WDM80_09470 [Limisphaerales bacterium]
MSVNERIESKITRGVGRGLSPVNLLKKVELERASNIWWQIAADIRPRYGLETSALIEYFHKHCYSMSAFCSDLAKSKK